MGHTVVPHIQGIVLCDHIYRDDETGKCVIAGTFNRVYLGEFPDHYQPASIYLNMSDFHGTHKLSFRFIQLATNEELDSSPEFELHHEDRREHHECIFDLPPLNFPEPGRYSVEIMYDGDSIGHVDIEACKLSPDEISG